ncbi:MAG: hypothetical protein D6692_02535 [Planctomycetota bacterium]|nr:MAG: hypothetical protein D6692_02535 [Planctomycetota bacterium]
MLGDATLGALMNPQPPAPLLGDANGDGAVTAYDIALVVNNIGRPSVSISTDPTGDGLTDMRDVHVVLSSLGNTGPTGVDPAPLPLLSTGGITGTCRNSAIGFAAGALIGYFGCSIAGLYNPLLGIACFDYVFKSFVLPGSLGVVGVCAAG